MTQVNKTFCTKQLLSIFTSKNVICCSFQVIILPILRQIHNGSDKWT